MLNQEEINANAAYRAQLFDDIERLERYRGRRAPLTEEEFRTIDDIALDDYSRDASLGRNMTWITLHDYIIARRNDVALVVNPRAFMILRYDCPCIYSTWAHTPQYNDRFLGYLCNKAIACGYAQTAQEAVKWAEEHK